MSWTEDLNRALKYIELHLNLDISLDQIASEARCSKYNFERLFSFITGLSLSYYIKKRIMDEATKELIQNETSITSVALKYGYENSSSFSKAYKKMMGFSPKDVLKVGNILTSFFPLSFEKQQKGLNEMKFRLEMEEGFTLHGISQEFTNLHGENFIGIPKMWDDLKENGQFAQLSHTCDESSRFKAVFGVCYNFSSDCNKFKYMIGVSGENKNYENLKINSMLYAKFKVVGVNNLQDTTRKIFSEWLPSSPYELADSPELEFYPLKMDKSDIICEIWIPIIKK